MNIKRNKTRYGGMAGAVVGGLLLLGATQAQAHFQMLVPSDDMVRQDEPRRLTLDVRFWHPFEGLGMSMERPRQFGVMVNGRKQDLLDSLKAVQVEDRDGDSFAAFTAAYLLRKPGDHTFYIEPQPYWEPAEESFIVHYTKVIVNAFGLEEGWDQPVGLKTEIVPLTRPYGLYAGNVFQGQVLLNGKPAPGTEVEIEYYNEDGSLSAEADPLITQVVKADANGVFTYAMPRAGWWTFAALNTDEQPMMREGKAYPVEIGALLWVRAHDMR